MKKWTAKKIQDARKKKNLTQTQLAIKLMCRQQTVSDWEKGNHTPHKIFDNLLNRILGA